MIKAIYRWWLKRSTTGKIYRHGGMVWRQPEMADLDQYELAKQVIFEALQATGSANLAGAWNEFSKPERWSRFLAALLVPIGREFDRNQVEIYARILRTFPAEWAEEVTSRFFACNQRSSGWLLMGVLVPQRTR